MHTEKRHREGDGKHIRDDNVCIKNYNIMRHPICGFSLCVTCARWFCRLNVVHSRERKNKDNVQERGTCYGNKNGIEGAPTISGVHTIDCCHIWHLTCVVIPSLPEILGCIKSEWLG